MSQSTNAEFSRDERELISGDSSAGTNQHNCGGKAQGSPLCKSETATVASNLVPPHDEICAWPFTINDAPPFAWWRTLPAPHCKANWWMLSFFQRYFAGNWPELDWIRPLVDDPAAAVSAALSRIPVHTMTIETDLVMTSLLLCALNGDAPAATILAHAVRQASLDHPFGNDLADSWHALDMRPELRPTGTLLIPKLPCAAARLGEKPSATSPSRGTLLNEALPC